MEHLPVKTTLRIALVGDYNPVLLRIRRSR